jgi:hypothetical protein
MRKASADLAEEITEAIRQASADLRCQHAEVTAELGSPSVDLDKALAHLDTIRSVVSNSQGEMLRAFETFRQQTRS